MQLEGVLRRAACVQLAGCLALVVSSPVAGGQWMGQAGAAISCGPSTLRARPLETSVALGTVQVTYSVYNTSPAPCSLSPSALAAAAGRSAAGLSDARLLASTASLAMAARSVTDVTAVFAEAGYPGALRAPKAPGLPGLPGPPGLPPVTLPPVLAPKPKPKPAPKPSPPPAKPASRPTRYSPGASGFDISWPQCGGAYPARPYTVAVVGANDGRSFTNNPCLTSEASWAGNELQLYLNVNSPVAANSDTSSGPAGRCSASGKSCMAYNYGYNDAVQSWAAASRDGVHAATWWLDVETAGGCTSNFPTKGDGYWSCDTALNSRTIQGAVDGLRAEHVEAGIYSTRYQWGVITGGYQPSGGAAPTWIPGFSASQTKAACSPSNSFGGGAPWLAQLYGQSRYDQDRAC